MDLTGFSKDQIRQIEEGQKSGVYVAVYAKKEYTAMHMEQLRLGLEAGLDVTPYADPAYDWFQMEEIRKGLISGLKVIVYASRKIPYEKMREVRKGLEKGIHLEKYLSFSAEMLRQVRIAVEEGVNIQKFIKAGYGADQLEQIIPALKEQLDIAPYLNPIMRGPAIREIRLGLESRVDVSLYASPEYSWRQMREIRLGLENGVDVSCYRNPYFEFAQMREIRLGLKSGLDVSGYARLMYTTKDMAKRRSALKKKKKAEIPQAERMTEQLKAVMVSVGSDEMEAYIIADQSLRGYAVADIVQVLRENGVVYGIDTEAVQGLIDGRYGDQELVRIAVGKPVEVGAAGWYEYFFRTEIARTPKLLGNGDVDYQNIEWFETVEEGQKIAQYHPATNGKNGITVTGRMIMGKRGHELPILKGTGWRVDAAGREYVAAQGGCIQIQGDYIQISQMYVFDSITLSTGNVSEKGTVYIRGNVGSGAKIHADADIIVDGFIEGAELDCGGTVFLRKGMNGCGRGSIRAGKDVTGCFFESVCIYAEGNLNADYCLDCEIHTQGKLILSGTKGAMIGGQVHSLCGIDVRSVGNGASIPTWVRIGQYEGSLEKQRKALEDAIAEAEHSLGIFRGAYADFMAKYPAEIRNGMDMFIKVEKAIYTKETELNELHERAGKLDESFRLAERAVAIVRGTAYEGVTFEFNGKKWKAKTVVNVRIKREANRIAVYTNG